MLLQLNIIYSSIFLLLCNKKRSIYIKNDLALGLEF